jgi:GNAT superfamily N-acetyltransferase
MLVCTASKNAWIACENIERIKNMHKKMLIMVAIPLLLFKLKSMDRDEFLDKTGEKIIIERITSGDFRENQKVFHDAYAALALKYPKMMEPALRAFKTVEGFLRFAFDHECDEFAAHRPTNYFIHAIRKGIPVSYLSFVVNGPRVIFRAFATLPEFQGLGIGKALTEFVSKLRLERPNLTHAQLIVCCENAAVVSFYKKLGFTESETHPDGFESMSMELKKT